MLRSIRSTAFLGTFLLAGVAAAQTKAPADDDNPIESGKPGTSSESTPAAKTEEAAAPTPVAVPAAPPPEEQPVAAPKAQKKRTVSGAGLDSQSLTYAAGNEQAVESTTSEKDWGFKFKGYFRGPMRIGITKIGVPATDSSGSILKDSNNMPIYTPGTLQFHAIPVTPDSNYTRWNFTGISPGPWAELFFQYGNQRVMMTTSIASYNITSGGWRELQDQLGIDRAFLTLKFPEALGNLGGMAWDVGVFSNFYGALGKYDGGEYQTYLFGRTRLAGATGTADIEINDDLKFVIEGGFGAKMDQMYQMYGGTIGANTLADNQPRYDYPTWQPYPGQNTQNGTNMLGHIHAGIVYDSILTLTLHYINSFVRDNRWNVAATGGTPYTKPAYIYAPGTASIQVMGGDLRLAVGWLDLYAGYSFINANHAGAISDSIEVLHSQGGWQMGQNYFQDLTACCVSDPPVNHINDGNGHIHSIAGQATFSLAGFMMRPRPFWGQGTDVNVTLFGMFNKITSVTSDYARHSKLKYGVDALYSFAPMMAFGVRGDVVNPNMSDSTQSFYAVSPKLIFRSEFVTHEAITLQYSRYFYGKAYSDPTRVDEVMPWPFGAQGTYDIKFLGGHPDENVVTLAASMWW